MPILFFLSSALFFIFLTAAIIFSVYRRRIALDQRVEHYFHSVSRVREMEEVSKEKKVPLPFRQVWNKGIEQVSKRTSKSERKKLDLLIRDAGYSGKLSPIEFRLIQLMISIGGGVAMLLLFAPLAENRSMTWVLSLAISFLCYRFSLFFLYKKRAKRILQINKDMPDFFDTVNLLIEAGLGLDGAISNVCQKRKGPLSDEFRFVLEDMKRGKSRREAFYELRMRVPSDSLQSALTTMIQADHLGIGMSKVIRNLTIRIREQKREAAREQAMKAPVKMLFPMVFFIFPSLFIVVLGPLIVKILTEGLMK